MAKERMYSQYDLLAEPTEATDLLRKGDASEAGGKVIPYMTVYVETTGVDSDATPGTQAEPFATLAGALNALNNRAPGYYQALVIQVGEGTFAGLTGFPLLFGSSYHHITIMGKGMGVTRFNTRFYQLGAINSLELVNCTCDIISNNAALYPSGTTTTVLTLSNIEFSIQRTGRLYIITPTANCRIVISGVVKVSGTTNNALTALISPHPDCYIDFRPMLDLSDLVSTDGGFNLVYLEQGRLYYRPGSVIPPADPNTKVNWVLRNASSVTGYPPTLTMDKVVCNGGTVDIDETSFAFFQPNAVQKHLEDEVVHITENERETFRRGVGGDFLTRVGTYDLGLPQVGAVAVTLPKFSTNTQVYVRIKNQRVTRSFDATYGVYLAGGTTPVYGIDVFGQFFGPGGNQMRRARTMTKGDGTFVLVLGDADSTWNYDVMDVFVRAEPGDRPMVAGSGWAATLLTDLTGYATTQEYICEKPQPVLQQTLQVGGFSAPINDYVNMPVPTALDTWTEYVASFDGFFSVTCINANTGAGRLLVNTPESGLPGDSAYTDMPGGRMSCSVPVYAGQTVKLYSTNAQWSASSASVRFYRTAAPVELRQATPFIDMNNFVDMPDIVSGVTGTVFTAPITGVVQICAVGTTDAGYAFIESVSGLRYRDQSVSPGGELLGMFVHLYVEQGDQYRVAVLGGVVPNGTASQPFKSHRIYALKQPTKGGLPQFIANDYVILAAPTDNAWKDYVAEYDGWASVSADMTDASAEVAIRLFGGSNGRNPTVWGTRSSLGDGYRTSTGMPVSKGDTFGVWVKGGAGPQLRFYRTKQNPKKQYIVGVEQETDEYWIDGKPIYKQTYAVGPFANAAVLIDAPYIDTFIKASGTSRAPNGSTLPLPYSDSITVTDSVPVSFTSAKKIGVWVTSTRWDAFTGYLTAYYTKL